MISQCQLSVIIPAHNEAGGIGRILEKLAAVLEQSPYSYEILVIDDASTDGTGKAAAQAGATVVRHPYCLGNGAAVKTGMRRAQGEILALMDADGQHDPEQLPDLLKDISDYDMVVGARVGDKFAPYHRKLANRFYNLLATYITNQPIRDLTSGFRVVKKDRASRFIYLLPNSFSYPTTITLALLKAGFSVKYVPIVPGRRTGKSKLNPWEQGWRFLLIILKITTLFSPFKIFLPISLTSLLLGLAWGAYMIIWHKHFSPLVLLLLIVAVLVFLMGLIAEEINMLRFERSEH